MLKALTRRITELYIPESMRRQGGDALRRAELVLSFTFTICFWGPLFAFLYFLLGLVASAAIILVGTCLGLLTPVILLKTRSASRRRSCLRPNGTS